MWLCPVRSHFAQWSVYTIRMSRMRRCLRSFRRALRLERWPVLTGREQFRRRQESLLKRLDPKGWNSDRNDR